MGLKTVFTPPLQTLGTMLTHPGRDIIHFDDETTTTFTKMSLFTDFLIQHSADASLYERDYFLIYLDKNIQWEGEVLNALFPSDKISYDGSKIFATVIFNIEEIYSDNEINSINMPYHVSKQISKYKQFRVNLSLPIDKSPLTLRQVLNNLIRWFLLGWRGKDYGDHVAYVRLFTDKATARPNTKMPELMNEFSKHRKHGNILIHRMIEHFINCIQESRAKYYGKIEPRIRNSFMFFYTDIVSPSLCGSLKLKILNVMPYFLNSRHSYSFHQTDYYPCEKTTIRSISIEIRNEKGALMDFLPGTTPTFVTLLFRKVAGIVKSIH